MILAIGAVDDRVRTRLSAHGELVEVDPGDAEAIGRWLPQAVGIVARAAATIDAAVIDAATALRVIGRSGVGKSVTLGNIMGFLKPDSGRVIVAHEDVTDFSEAEWRRIRKKVTMVFQSGALFDSMTVAENVLFSLELREDYDFQNKEDVVKMALESGKLKPDALTAALAFSMNANTTAITDLLKKAGATPPMQIDAFEFDSMKSTLRVLRSLIITMSSPSTAYQSGTVCGKPLRSITLRRATCGDSRNVRTSGFSIGVSFSRDALRYGTLLGAAVRTQARR